MGSGRAAAFVSGDTALWAQPEEDVHKLVPNYPLFWAMLGVARQPTPGTVVKKYENAKFTAWQFGNGPDTIDYVRTNGPPVKLMAEVRSAGKRIGTVETQYGPDGFPESSRLIVPAVPARLDITFYSNLKAKPFAPDTWSPPEP